MNVHLDFPVASNASIHMEPTNACVQKGMKYSLITQMAVNPFQVSQFIIFFFFLFTAVSKIICDIP